MKSLSALRFTIGFAVIMLATACDQAPTATKAQAMPEASIVRNQLAKVVAATQVTQERPSESVELRMRAVPSLRDLSTRVADGKERMHESDRAVHAIVVRFAQSPASINRVADALHAGRRIMTRAEVLRFIEDYRTSAASPRRRQASSAVGAGLLLFSGRVMHENLEEVCTDISLAIYSTTQEYNAQRQVVAEREFEMELALAGAIVEPTESNIGQAAVAVLVWENEMVYSSMIYTSLNILATMYDANGCWV